MQERWGALMSIQVGNPCAHGHSRWWQDVEPGRACSPAPGMRPEEGAPGRSQLGQRLAGQEALQVHQSRARPSLESQAAPQSLRHLICRSQGAVEARSRRPVGQLGDAHGHPLGVGVGQGGSQGTISAEVSRAAGAAPSLPRHLSVHPWPSLGTWLSGLQLPPESPWQGPLYPP